jgi:hypothetical protein
MVAQFLRLTFVTAIFVSFINMATYVYNNGWQQLTGTDRPYVYDGANWQGVKQIYAYDNGAWRQVYQYDNTGPTVPTPTVTNAATAQTVSWTAITDDSSGVASATLYQRFVGTSSGDVAGTSYALPSFASGSTTMAVPLNRRKQGSGESWSAYYYIIASDVAGNSTTGSNSSSVATSPYDVVAPTVQNHTCTGLSNGNMRFSWTGGSLVTDDNTGVASVKIQVQYTPWAGSGEGWADFQILNSTQWQATSGSFDFTPSTSKRRQWSGASPYAETVPRYYVDFRVVAVDNAGNTTTLGADGALTKPYGTLTVLPNNTGAGGADSYSVSPAQWNGLTQGGVRFGDGTSSGLGNWTNGAYFYNTQLQDACLGYAPDSGTFFVQRKASQGLTGTAYFKYHNLTNSAGVTNATFGGDFTSLYMTGANASGTLAMPANWLSAIPSGTARGFGMLNGGSSTAIKVLYSHGESFSPSGMITISFT